MTVDKIKKLISEYPKASAIMVDVEDLSSLITTIESQKAEIEKLTARIFQHRKALGYVVFFQVEDDPDIKNVIAEGYKAENERLKSTISMISMYNGSINSFEEIETIINSLQEGEK